MILPVQRSEEWNVAVQFCEALTNWPAARWRVGWRRRWTGWKGMKAKNRKKKEKQEEERRRAVGFSHPRRIHPPLLLSSSFLSDVIPLRSLLGGRSAMENIWFFFSLVLKECRGLKILWVSWRGLCPRVLEDIGGPNRSLCWFWCSINRYAPQDQLQDLTSQTLGCFHCCLGQRRNKA